MTYDDSRLAHSLRGHSVLEVVNHDQAYFQSLLLRNSQYESGGFDTKEHTHAQSAIARAH